MATLTETAAIAKKTVKWGGLAVILFILVQLGIGFYKTYILVIKPEPPPPPTVAFGKLPEIAFAEKLHPELTLRLETPTGGTPNLGDRVDVYLMPTFRSNFLALDEAKETAKKMRFTGEPKEITERRFRWENDQFLPSTLEMDIIDGSFMLKRNWQADPTILTDKQLPGKEQAVVETQQFLSQAGLLIADMKEARAEVSYLNFSAGQYTKAVSLSEADFVQVDLFRPDINELAVMPANPKKGIIRLIFSGSREAQKRVVQAEYNYFPVDLQQMADYPIKSASIAWRELQTRQGFVASVGNSANEVKVIRRIYLGYYDGEKSQGFLMPIIVFEGDDGFFAYVQAITNEWLEELITIGN